MQTPFFTVIIPTFNRAEILDRNLEALNKQTIPQSEIQIIVVNDGGNDKTDEVTSKWSKIFKNLKYIKQQNLGQGIARNNALKYAEGELILFIGDDIILEENALEEHRKIHEKHPELNVAVLGFTTWHPEIKVTPFMKWLTEGRKGGPQFAYDMLENKKTADYRFFYTSNLSLKKSILVKHQFDPDFKNYGWEDIELGYRLTKKENLKIYYNKSAIGYHYHEIDESSLEHRMISIGKSAKIFQKKHPELKILPSQYKKIIFQVITSTPFLTFVKIVNKNFYYYCLSKKFLLKGIESSSSITPHGIITLEK